LSWNDIERGFGVLQRKFHIVQTIMESWFLSCINDLVKTCILLHNMMVEEYIKRDEKEDSSSYCLHGDNNLSKRIIDNVTEDVERAEVEMNLHRQMDEVYCSGEAVNVAKKEGDISKSWFSFHHQCCLARWAEL
jgi:Plant transposon protein